MTTEPLQSAIAFPKKDAISAVGKDGTTYQVCCQECVDQIKAGKFPKTARSERVRRSLREAKAKTDC